MPEPGRKQGEERQLRFSGGSSWVADPPPTPPGPLLAQQRCRGLPGGGTAKLLGEGTRKSGAGGPRRQGRSLAHPLGDGTALREPLPKLCFLLPGRCSAGREGGRRLAAGKSQPGISSGTPQAPKKRREEGRAGASLVVFSGNSPRRARGAAQGRGGTHAGSGPGCEGVNRGAGPPGRSRGSELVAFGKTRTELRSTKRRRQRCPGGSAPAARGGERARGRP